MSINNIKVTPEHPPDGTLLQSVVRDCGMGDLCSQGQLK